MAKIVFASILIFIFFEPLSLAQITISTRPSEPREALTKGYAAAKQQHWDLAIRYFHEAQKAVPTSPQALFNLALAYDKAGGREVSAITWYLAYTASYPKAPNLDPVRKRIAELEMAVEANARKLLNVAEKARETVYGNPKGLNRSVDLCLAFAQVRLGEKTKAQLTLEKIAPPQQSPVLEEMVVFEIKKGDIFSAKQIAMGIKSERVLIEILKQQLNHRKIVEAMETASLIGPKGYYKTAQYLALTGNNQLATETAGVITRALAAHYGKPFEWKLRSQAFYEIATIQAVNRNLSGARESVSKIESAELKSKADQYIKNVQIQGGERVLAEEEIGFWSTIEKQVDSLSGCGDAGSATSDLIGNIVIQDLVKYLKPSKEEKDPWNYIHCLAAGASSLMKILDIIRENKIYWERRKGGEK